VSAGVRTAERSNRRLVGKLLAMTAASFAFAFALVPLYDVFCEITGLNGKTGVVDAHSVSDDVDTSRWVTVEFVGGVQSGLDWEFAPVERRMRVHPGGVYDTRFYARNRAETTTVGQAVPSVAPSKASLYFNKTECFCFSRQVFGPGEGREMPVRFVVDRDLPDSITTLTLSYTFFNANGG